MAGPLDGLDLSAPSPTKKQQPPAATPTTNTSGPLAGIDLSAPAPTAPAASEVPWFSFGSGPDKVGEFVGKMADSASAGWGAQALDKLGVAQGPSGQTVSQQINSAGKDIGPVASGLADAAGYVAGPGKLALGERLAGGLGGGYLARIGGSAAESGLASGVGTLGHGGSAEDALKAGTTGALIGAATGAIPGARGAKAGTPSPTSDLQDAASQAYAPLSNTRYPTASVERVVNSVNVPQGLQAKMSNNLSDQIDRIKGIVAQGGKTTANDIADFRASILGAARTPADSAIAQQYVSALENGVGPQITATIATANKASNVAKTSGEIDNWITQAQRSPGKVPDAVNKAITDNPGFYKSVMPQLQDVANTGSSVGSKLWEAAKKPVIGAAIDAGANYVAGQSPLAGAITGGLTGAIMGHGTAQMRSSDLVSKLAAARHFNATGESLPPSSFAPGLGPVVGPMVAYAPKVPAGLGASGAFTGLW